MISVKNRGKIILISFALLETAYAMTYLCSHKHSINWIASSHSLWFRQVQDSNPRQFHIPNPRGIVHDLVFAVWFLQQVEILNLCVENVCVGIFRQSDFACGVNCDINFNAVN